MSHVIMASFGNDSIALIQWAREAELEGVTVLYNNTGWAAPWWSERVEQGENWVRSLGFNFVETVPERGFMDLVRWKQAFPMGGMQFCTEHLKRTPALRWMDENAPKGSTVLVGIRRCESRKRAEFPKFTEGSLDQGGRDLWAPLVDHTDEMRNQLLASAGFDVLPHRSAECYPCINSGKTMLRFVDEDRINLIEVFEKEMGVGKRSGKPKYMFRPSLYSGAQGIREVIRWAGRDKYIAGQEDMFGDGCDGGFCE